MSKKIINTGYLKRDLKHEKLQMNVLRYYKTNKRWIDGDTLQVEIDLRFYVQTTQKIRLTRIDAP
ncbi:hypothetical protein [Aquimarina aquimarini]|uniref:hypothetical protein n=1 Tax=Aquimarina aquimarini TaxID=1191734 RepID=UPI000D55E2F7|nr:hypothetical protein [Aquimarina aquimarini]